MDTRKKKRRAAAPRDKLEARTATCIIFHHSLTSINKFFFHRASVHAVKRCWGSDCQPRFLLHIFKKGRGKGDTEQAANNRTGRFETLVLSCKCSIVGYRVPCYLDGATRASCTSFFSQREKLSRIKSTGERKKIPCSSLFFFLCLGHFTNRFDTIWSTLRICRRIELHTKIAQSGKRMTFHSCRLSNPHDANIERTTHLRFSRHFESISRFMEANSKSGRNAWISDDTIEAPYN